jgi:hypothetical protein
MLPTYQHNDLVVAVARPFFRLVAGRVAVVACAEPLLIIKRIKIIAANGDVVLASDNSANQSRHCGVTIENKRVLGLIVYRLPRRMMWL